MNITTDAAQESWHRLDDPGAYEWWYFDAEDRERDISIVIIWFSGFAFSPFYMRHYDSWRARRRADSPRPDQYAGFSFQVYERGREIVNFIREGRDGLAEFSPDGIGVRFDRNRFTYDPVKDEYLITVDFDFPARHLHLSGSFSFRPTHRFDYRKSTDCMPGREHRHQWLLSVPKADVEGELVISGPEPGQRSMRSIRGRGYHDHNLGSMPMHEYFRRWYWGRVFSERYDLVYYAVWFRQQRCTPLTLILLNDHERGVQQVIEGARVSERRRKKGVFAPLHGREISLEADRIGIGVDHHKVLDSGPFYLRFSSRFHLTVDGVRTDGVDGISEFLDPSALQSPFMRFFTASRIWRDGETTAMYRYYNFFKHQFDWLNRKKF